MEAEGARCMLYMPAVSPLLCPLQTCDPPVKSVCSCKLHFRLSTGKMDKHWSCTSCRDGHLISGAETIFQQGDEGQKSNFTLDTGSDIYNF